MKKMWILLCIRNKIKDFIFKQTKYYHDFGERFKLL